jgi:hypothetical protein
MNEWEVEQISGTACESRFKVQLGQNWSIVLRLWIVTGGTPALAFDDYSYTRRFPVVERYSNAHWNGREYQHQTRDGWGIIPVDQTPSFDDLPNGLQDVQDFLAHALPLRAKRDARMAELPKGTIRSRRMHDKENRTYVQAEIKISEHGVSRIGTSTRYSGGLSHVYHLLPVEWRMAYNVCNTIFHNGTSAWEQLTDQQFAEVKSALWAVYESEQKGKRQ